VRFILPDVFPGQNDPKFEKEERKVKLRELLALHKIEEGEGSAGEEDEEKETMLMSSSSSSSSLVIKPLLGWNGGAVSPEVESQLGGAWEDQRRCSLCKLGGDDPFLGRLLLLEEKERAAWIHLNCAAWSSEAVELEGGLYHVGAARSRAKNLKCAACGVSGATVGCYAPGCKENYHFICAVGSGCRFFVDRRVFCKDHQAAALSQTTKGGKPCKPCVELPPLDLLESNAFVKIIPAPPANMGSAAAAAAAAVIAAGGGVSSVQGLGEGVALRVGALTIFELGGVVQQSPFFHTERYIFPKGYRASRIFWSAKKKHERTLWMVVIGSTEDMEGGREGGKEKKRKLARLEEEEEELEEGEEEEEVGVVEKPWFRIVAMDDPGRIYEGGEVEGVYAELLHAVKTCQGSAVENLRVHPPSRSSSSSSSTLARPLPCIERKVPGVGSKVATYGLSAFDFVGLANPTVKRLIEGLTGAVVTALHQEEVGEEEGREGGGGYRFCFVLPEKVEVKKALRVLEAAKRKHVVEESRCARVDNNQVYAEVAGRMARANKVRIAEEIEYEEGGGSGGGAGGGGGGRRKGEGAPGGGGGGEGGSAADGGLLGPGLNSDNRSVSQLYRELKAIPFSQRLLVKRSRIHGWGLFAKEAIKKDAMVAEYIGEVVRACVADLRERMYEESGQGSCYLFRLDKFDIVDATLQGNMARFVNHCCDPNCYARIISVDTGEKKIIFLAKRDIAVGEEVSYNYHFTLEDEKIPCYCGAANCVGSMN